MNKILAAWAWNGPVSEPIAYGEGHINQTYALTEQATQKRYILQKINTDTFKDPDGLMENICGVTDFLREKAKQRGADPERATLHVALTKAGKPYYKAADGGCWRVYDFVENTVCLQQVQSAENFYQSAVAFGNFQHQLADYPANTLHETIPHFHDTPKRFADFQRAVAEDRMGRAAQVQREIEFVRAREEDYHVMVDLLTAGKLPLRVTHNDTKLNNILFDKTTGEGLCVIDLDTVMPGLAANGEGFPTIEYSTNDAGYHTPVAEYVQQAWGELGITVNINKVEWASFLPMRRAGDYDISRNGWSMDYNDPSNMLELFTTNNGNNDGKYANPAFDKLIEESRVADKATHFEKLHEAEDMLMADAACIPVAYYNDFWLQSPSLKGTWHSPYGYWYLQYGYIEE